MTFFPADLSDMLQAVLGAVFAYTLIIAAVRIVGLRSFAKMASHDFAVTVAIGSILASAAMASDVPLAVPLVAVVSLFAMQYALSYALSRSDSFSNLVQNDPLLLMDGSTILHANLKAAEVSEAELRGKLREANVTHLDQVLAVVFEATGDVSVLHAEPGATLQDYLLTGVEQ